MADVKPDADTKRKYREFSECVRCQKDYARRRETMTPGNYVGCPHRRQIAIARGTASIIQELLPDDLGLLQPVRSSLLPATLPPLLRAVLFVIIVGLLLTLVLVSLFSL